MTNKFNLISSLIPRLQRLPENVRLSVQTVLVSLAAGLSAVAFMFFTHLLFSRSYLFFATLSRSKFIIYSLLMMVISSLLVGLLLKLFASEAAGSGVPQVKSAFWKELGWMPLRSVLIKFLGGILSIGGGHSVGREGPSIFIGAGVASNLCGALGTPRRERRGAAIVGAAAGLAAAFNTPLAAITFAIEEVTGDMNSRFLGRVVLGAVLGAFVVYGTLGRQPAFSLPAVENVSWLHYAIVPVAALVASFAGHLFKTTTLRLRGRFIHQRRMPVWLMPLCGGLLTWSIGVMAFMATGKLGVFGLGYQDLSSALNNLFDWRIAGILVLAKLIATIVSYSFGAVGGIFAPSLFLGGMSGYFVAGLFSLWIPLTPSDCIVLSAVGMSACLGTIVHAPLTCTLIVFEMTHQFTLVPGLLLGALISQRMARFSGPLNFYDAILVQDGHELHKIRPPVDLQSWQSLPVSAIANPQPVVLTDTTPESLRRVVNNYSYGYFPYVIDGELKGIVGRVEILKALTADREPEMMEAVCCYPDQTVREVGNQFIASPANILVVLARDTRRIVGIITLHDVLRAQAAIQS